VTLSPSPSGGVRILALLLFLQLVGVGTSSGTAQIPETSVILGTVRSEGSGNPLPGAAVEIEGTRWSARMVTGASGGYRIDGVPAGRNLLRVRHLGHSDLEIEILVPGGREVALDLSLPVRPIVLDPVTVESDPPGPLSGSGSEPTAELGLAGVRALGATPGLSELGLGDAVRGIPGREPADPSSVLYVRGAAADLKLVFLDGAPVYAPFPLGGLLEPFSPGLLRDADVYLGGAPARYDGGLSYVMDLRTRTGSPGRLRTSGSLDLLSGRALLEGGVPDRVNIIATGRAIHPLADLATGGQNLPYGYREGLMRGDIHVGKGIVSVTGFANEEEVRIADSAGSEPIEWGNTAASVRYRGRLGGGTLAEFTAARGDYAARLPLFGTRPAFAEGSAHRSRFSADLVRRTGDVHFAYGASYDRQLYEAAARVLAGGAASAEVVSSGEVGGVYGELSGGVGPRVRLRGGLRADHFFDGRGLAWAPRIASTWMVTDRAALTLALGRYHQFLRPPDEVLLRSADTTEEFARSPTLAVGRASHFTVGLDQEFGEGVRLGLEGFYKNFADIPGGIAADANASGVDLWVRRTAGEWTGWIGYSLSWAWSAATFTPGGSFTGRHLLSSALAVPLGERLNLDLRFAYGAGLPYSPIPLASSQPTPERGAFSGAPGLTAAVRGGTESAPLLHPPDDPYLRLDAAIAGRFAPRWGARTLELSPYLRLLNGLGRRDALFYLYDRARGESPHAIGSLPIVPVAGLEWSF